MAEAAVRNVADWVGKLLLEEGKYIWPVEEKMRELRRELSWMQCFLRQADCLQRDEVVSHWIIEINEFVSEAEDIVDRFFIKIESRKRHSRLVDKVKRCICFGEELYAMHQTVKSIDTLIVRIANLTPRLEKYGLKTTYGMETRQVRENFDEQAEFGLIFSQQKREAVGFEKDVQVLVDALLEVKPERKVIAIHGMGGLGKTTLCTEVSNDKRIKSHFNGGYIWLYISKHFKIQNVLQQLLAGLHETDLSGMASKSLVERRSTDLMTEVCKVLEKKPYLVVLDDVWEIGVWELLNSAFPLTGLSASKILLTTRKKEVAEYVDPNALPKPDPLTMDLSWSLLFQTLGWFSRHVSSGGIQPENALKEHFGTNGAEVADLGELMHCNGIPLAIVVLAGILSKKKSAEEWKLVQNNLSSYLRRGTDRGRSYMDVLALSFNDLEYHLKPCFLHLASFPEDYQIHVDTLCRIWVAEGIVTWPCDRVAGSETLEDIAREYVTDLVQSGMIQLACKGSNRSTKYVRLHDVMRDLCMQKAVTGNFLQIIDHRSCPNEPFCITASASHERLLRIAVYLGPGVENFLPDSSTSKAHMYVRSLLFFDGREVDGEKCEKWISYICKNFPWIRVLDIEGISVKGKLSKDVKKLIHLRYLNLRDTCLTELPSAVGKLSFLETLDLRVSISGSFKLSNCLWKLCQLRHLFLPETSYEVDKFAILRLDTLVCLETLEHLELGKSRIKDVQKMKKLKKLSIKDVVAKVENIRVIAECPALKSGSLRACSLSVLGSVIDNDPSIFSNMYCLDQLRVMERISGLEDNILPQCLEVLHLEGSELESDPMSVLGRLRHLKNLTLGHGSFCGTRITCLPKSFPELKILHLEGLSSIETWTVESDSMSRLEKLVIIDCGVQLCIPVQIPETVHITCSPCIKGIERYGTCASRQDTSSTVSDREEQTIVSPNETGNILMELFEKSKCVALIGACGISKTNLSDMLFQHQGISAKYKHVAWVRCPSVWDNQDCIYVELMLKIWKQLDQTFVEDQMRSKIMHCSQGLSEDGECLIVLMDVKSLPVDVLNELTGNFASFTWLICSSEASTTLDAGVELQNHILNPLTQEQSLDLFAKMLGNGALEGVDIVQHCSGNPLSIIMLARLLQQTPGKLDFIKQRLERGKQNVYDICYEDLTPCQKNCFMFMATFPYDAEVSANRLCRLWIAADIVTSHECMSEAVEVTAQKCLKELVAKGFLQIGKRNFSGTITSCWVQAPLHVLCTEKAEQNRFVCRKGRSQPPPSSESFDTVHLAVHFDKSAMRVIQNYATGAKVEQLRTFVAFSEISGTDTIIDWISFAKICTRFPCLTILDLEGMFAVKGMFHPEICELNHLKYLSLRGTGVGEIHSSIGKLSLLETLDLRVKVSLFIPNMLSTLTKLRHLFLPDSVAPWSPTLGLSGLHRLCTLANLNTAKVDLSCLRGMKCLEKISIKRIHSGPELDEKLIFIPARADLSISSNVFVNKRTILSEFQNLQRVTIKGEITVPLKFVKFPGSLKELRLKHSKLQYDPVAVLGKLSNLRRLSFDHDSLMGSKITFTGGVFPNLTYLGLRGLRYLEEVERRDVDHLPEEDVVDCCRLVRQSQGQAPTV